MKINIEQLPSGAYRIRKTVKGKTYRITVDHKPTESEALRILSDAMGSRAKPNTPLTFSTAAERHLEALDGVLSLSTVRGYRYCLDALKREYGRFCAMKIRDIASEDVQRIVTRHSKTHAPKTTENLYGFICVVLRAYAPSVTLHVALPPKMPKEPYIPTAEDIKAVLEALRGSEYEAGIRLALCGLRRSEICGASVEDLTPDNYLFVHRATVQDEHKNWVTVDRTKTPESTRYVRIPDDLADLIRRQGYIYNGKPESISKRLVTVQKRLGLPHFSLHKLRHFYVSYAHAIGIPDSFIMQNCGYRSDGIMKRTYRHPLTDYRAEMDKRVLDSMEKALS